MITNNQKKIFFLLPYIIHHTSSSYIHTSSPTITLISKQYIEFQVHISICKQYVNSLFRAVRSVYKVCPYLYMKPFSKSKNMGKEKMSVGCHVGFYRWSCLKGPNPYEGRVWVQEMNEEMNDKRMK